MKRNLEQRRQRNRELAAEDAKYRCAFCRKALPARAVVRLDGTKFCGDDCVESFEERERLVNR